eukprot:8463002-Alexandrium_andersonii.AAC.1
MRWLSRCAKARVRHEFRVELHRARLERGAQFLREHPANASSWRERCVQGLLGEPGVSHGVGH